MAEAPRLAVTAAKGLLLVSLLAMACSASRTPPITPANQLQTRLVRIALSEGRQEVRLTSTGAWQIVGADGQTIVALTQPGEQWLLFREGGAVRAMRADSRPVSATEVTLIVRPLDETFVSVDGKRYRGEIAVSALGAGLTVVNRLPIEQYLRGVVPLEIGTSSQADVAAVEAQAITARSYAVTHLAGPTRAFDMRATVNDQVYGGVGVETRVANAAVEHTAGLVLMYGGQVVNAPYSSTCGGTSAEPQDVWRANGAAYLKRVSDQVPGSSRYYCDAAPRYRWSRTFARDELRQNIARYLRTIGKNADVASISAVTVTDVTPAGRVATLTVDTDRTTLVLRGNEIRSALRTPSGEILYSTYFSVDAVPGRGGIEQLVLRGGGHGHGVGMCQSGAIGRARAGQDFRTILSTYYPGTTVGTL